MGHQSPAPASSSEAAAPRSLVAPLASVAANQSGMIVLVVCSGAIGGLIAWVLEESTGGHLLPWKPLAAICAAMLLGGGAAGVGVYVLATTDLRQLGRALFFALLCGVFFKPVWKAGSGFIVTAVNRPQAQSTGEDVLKSTNELNKSVDANQAGEVQANVKEVADSTTDLLDKTAMIPDLEARKPFELKSAEAVDAIAKAAQNSPEASIDGLTQIGLTAQGGGHDQVTSRVIGSLRTIESTSRDQVTIRKAQQALGRFRRKLF